MFRRAAPGLDLRPRALDDVTYRESARLAPSPAPTARQHEGDQQARDCRRPGRARADAAAAALVATRRRTRVSATAVGHAAVCRGAAATARARAGRAASTRRAGRTARARGAGRAARAAGRTRRAARAACPRRAAGAAGAATTARTTVRPAVGTAAVAAT